MPGKTYSFYTDDETAQMMDEMSTQDVRSLSNLITVLVRAEFARRCRQLTQPLHTSDELRTVQQTNLTPGLSSEKPKDYPCSKKSEKEKS